MKGFEERLARQEELSAAVRALLEGEAGAAAVKALGSSRSCRCSSERLSISRLVMTSGKRAHGSTPAALRARG